MSTPDTPATRNRWLIGAAIVLMAANLRVAVGSVGVVLGDLQDDLGMSSSVAGVLATLPVLSFALMGSTAHHVVRRVGLHRTAALVLALAAAGLGIRAAADSVPLFLVASFVALGGAAIGNVVLPGLAKESFPDRLPLISALYGAAIMGGAALGSVVTVPVEQSSGWRTGLGLWAVVALVSLLPWLPLLGRDRHVDPTGSTRISFGRLARSPMAWCFALCFGSQSAQAYAQFGWFPALLERGGVPEAYAGTLLGILSAVGLPLTLALPWAIRRAGRTPVLPWFFALVTVAGWAGTLWAPTAAPLAWALLLGLGGGAFTWTLTMVGLRTASADAAVALSGFTQGIGYLYASIGPFGTGLLHDVTGTWTVPVTVLMLVALLIGVFGTVIARGGTPEQTLPPR